MNVWFTLNIFTASSFSDDVGNDNKGSCICSEVWFSIGLNQRDDTANIL